MTLRAALLNYLYAWITRVVLRVFPRAVAEALALVFGIWTAILPLLIWVAWSADVLFTVLLSGAVSTTLYAIFAIATAPYEARSEYRDWTQQRANFETERAQPRKSTWRDIA